MTPGESLTIQLGQGQLTVEVTGVFATIAETFKRPERLSKPFRYKSTGGRIPVTETPLFIRCEHFSRPCRSLSASSQSDRDRERHAKPASPRIGAMRKLCKQVEAIMSRIESGELELADVFDQFASAVSYLRQCDLFLTQRQQQMDLLIETLTDDPE